MFFSDSQIPEDTRVTVNRAIERGRLPQSVMLSGGSQSLREKCAAELCLAVLCNEPVRSHVPCGKCASCRKVLSGTHPDMIKVVPSGDRKTVSVDNIKQQVFGTLYKSPTQANNKVYIFNEADGLSVQIQNALLKTIEEPPEDAMFIFLCENREGMLVTVISRLTEYALGDTLSAQECVDEKVVAITKGIVQALVKEDEYALMLKTAPMQKNRKLIAQVAQKLTAVVRDALVENSGASMFSGCEDEAMYLSMNYSPPSLVKIKNAMDKIVASASANANENLLLTLFSSSLAGVIKNRLT